MSCASPLGARGGARAGSPRFERIWVISAGSSMTAMILSRPAQFGQRSMSMSRTRFSSRVQLIRAALPCACPSTGSVVVCTGYGMIAARSLAFGANTPWKPIRCSRGRTTSPNISSK